MPLFVIFSTLVQTMGATFGARAMGDSVDTSLYWTSREKWTMFQFYKAKGYSPTQDGFKNDVFNLYSKANDKCGTVLFELVAPLHKTYIEARNAVRDPEKKLQVFDDYRTQIANVRDRHYSNFENTIEEALDKQWLLYEEIVPSKPGYFELSDMETELPYFKKVFYVKSLQHHHSHYFYVRMCVGVCVCVT